MKIKYLLFIICLAPINLCAQHQYLIKGKIGKLNTPHKIVLTYQEKSGELKKDTSNLSNGAFSLTGQVDEPKEAWLTVINTGPHKPADTKDMVHIFLEQGLLEISSKNSLSKATFPGVNLTNDMIRLSATVKPIQDQYAKLLDTFNTLSESERDTNKIEEIKDEIEKTVAEKTQLYKKFALENLKSYAGLKAYKYTLGPGTDAAVVEPEFLRFDPKLRNTGLGRNIAKRIEDAKKLSIGEITDFSLPDANENPIKLSDFKGKYVLVDFWASWCVPCRIESSNIIAQYNKYKNKNLVVLAVSLDKDKQAWLKAIENGGLTSWIHVTDLKGWNSEVVEKYSINSIPFNFLVDPEGKIIAKGIKGKKLRDIMSKLFYNPITKPPLPHLKPGSPAFNFSYPDRNGKLVTMADLKGKVVLVDVWFTACRPCIEGFPDLEKLAEEMKGTDFQIVSICADSENNKGRWLKILHDKNPPGLHLFDSNEGTDLRNFYIFAGVPYLMVFDRQGKIVQINAPRPSKPELKALIQKTLAEK